MLEAFSLTDIGKKRTTNQDFVYATVSPIGNLPNLFVVADGMGGYNGGDYASSYAVDVIKETAAQSKEKNPRRIFEAAITEANSAVRKKAMESPDLEGMGTTVVIASFVDGVLQIANVGDSRLYIVDDDIRQITEDHSYVEEMIKVGSLDRESARNHPQKNIITRAVGATEEVVPDFFTVKLKKDDLVLMCTDGLTNMVEDNAILTILKEDKDVKSKTEELVKAANDNGGKDNISVILIGELAD